MATSHFNTPVKLQTNSPVAESSKPLSYAEVLAHKSSKIALNNIPIVDVLVLDCTYQQIDGCPAIFFLGARY